MEEIAKVAAVRAILVLILASAPLGAASLSASQQNELVAKYCGVCHSDARPNGGISLEHFDAARPDAGMVAMMLSKFQNGAFGASGTPLPDKPTQQALISALTGATAGAGEWIVNRSEKPGAWSASIVREAKTSIYRLTLSCRPETGRTEMQVAWSPGVPKDGREITVTADGNASASYIVSGQEAMGNGQAGTSGPGAWILAKTPVPRQKLTVANVFGDEAVEFPFEGLAIDESACRTITRTGSEQ